MLSFKTYIAEGFTNLILSKHDQDREKYATQVWDMLQVSYAKIGGIKGSGFSSVDDMIKTIPFWKLYFDGDRLKTVILYKDRGGRKAIAVGTDGSQKALKVLADVIRESFKVSFGEYSKGLLAFIIKTVPRELLKSYAIPNKKVSDILDDSVIIIPTQEYVNDNLQSADQAMYTRFKDWREYFYVREIGGTPLLKMAIGTPGKPIL
jgi:hypothetical protein